MIGTPASADTLMRQAHMTADEYFRNAVKYIDDVFGEGYAKKHPELVGKFMETAVMDFLAVSVAGSIEGVAESLEKMAESMDGIADALSPAE